ncbi:NlpC/P60 family protein, partial [Streptomyces sp. NPDC059740]|uniref:C40 family peptidase n=1 Tax=Streptomyces sp. NPDC059740 TaxID=3346926 RepID=UPI00365E7231
PGRPRGLAAVRRTLVTCTALVLCATGALLAGGSAAYADPVADGGEAADARLAAVHRQIDRLYREAESATEAYDAAKEKTDRQQRAVDALSRDILHTQSRINALQKQVGALASAQYRAGGVPPGAKLAFSSDPGSFLEGATLTRKAQAAAHTALNRLAREKDTLRDHSREARTRWRQLVADRKAKEATERNVRHRISAARKVESRLQEAERRRLAGLEAERAAEQQRQWLASGKLGKDAAKASPAGRKAVAYATAQLGKDYVWGAEGPDTFDCSGLTMRAWQAAGHPVPRTSQEQWRRLPHVPLREIRPGDLVVYFDDASHVALYVGGGRIIHAPRPGRQVTVTGAGTMKILGVVRPDGDGAGGGDGGAVTVSDRRPVTGGGSER